MATIKGMSSLDLIAITHECTELLPLWIHKIYQLEDRSVIIRLNGLEKKKYTLIIEPGRRVHLVPSMPDAPTYPPSFAMLLRKYLHGGKVIGITQKGLQRIVILSVQKADGIYHLVSEIFDDGNIILTDEAHTIIQPLRHMRFRERTIVPGQVYLFPADDITETDAESTAAMMASSDLDLVRFLAVSCFLGGMYAESLCMEHGLDKLMPASKANPQVLRAAVFSLIEKVTSIREPVITKSGVYPFPTGEEVIGSGFLSFNEACGSYFPFTEKKEQQKRPYISREDRIKKQQEAAIISFQKKIAKNEEIGTKIYENYSFVNDIITTLRNAAKTRSWQDIENIIQASKTGPAEKILKVLPGSAAVELDIGVPVIIHINESVEENCGRYYDLAKKYKRKMKGAYEAMEKAVPVQTKKVHSVIRPKKRWYHRFRWCFTSDAVLMIGGRDAGQNEELVKRYMEGNDFFVHADVHGASVVILKGETAHWDEVAIFAASYSGAWRSGHFTADVFAVNRDQVSKTAESGEYVSRGSFIIRGERKWMKNTQLRIAIGLAEQPVTQVIGGPESVISTKASFFVVLQPGMYEPNDIAKKVLKQIRDALPKEKQNALKFALNAESIAAFVPPGGSDIIT